MSTRTSDCIEIAAMRSLCKRFKTGFSRSLVEGGLVAERVLHAKIDVTTYEGPSDFAKDYLLYSFLRKWKGWNAKDLNPRAQAVASWTASEHQNCLTNRRLFPLFLDGSYHPLFDFISKAQRKIERVIGSHPQFDSLDRLCRWSGGATFDLRRGSTITDKMSNSLTVTQRALPHALRVISDDPAWKACFPNGEVTYTIVKGNRCVTVPKTALTDRMIAAEPTANAFMQQAVGRFIRARLKGFGVDLDDQSVNQELAFKAIADDLSTLDLSSASDTLSLALCELLLPPAWYEYLGDLRSPMSRLDGKWYLLEKFSSMGNAYTFELESLIFWALSKTVCEELQVPGAVSVYGDDIIVPKLAYDSVVSVLRWSGFSVNQEKSYKDGHFFESCGKHFFDLEDVTPIYQKEVCANDLFELVRLHNRLYRWGKRNGLYLVKDTLRLIIDHALRKHKKLPYTPDVQGDFGFITDDSTKYEVNRNGDYRCLCIVSQSNLVYAARDIDQRCYYAYKLREPHFTNSLPDGNVSYDAGERRFLTMKRIWGSSLSLVD